VNESLPAGTPFALRVFGHREARSCRTDLEAPLAPLDAGTIAKKIAAIEPMDRSKTPIAHSLELVAQDLSGARGPCVVVLLTDGEETCDGDPAATIEALRGRGVDVRVSIVGFAIDDAELKTTFRYWANLGGGEYHDATGAGDLAASIRSSLRAPFEVLDGAGNVVASGTVGGEAVTLPAGGYQVRVGSDPALRTVNVAASAETVLDLGA